MVEQKCKIGIVGAGGIARICHIPGMKKLNNVEIIGIADIKEESAKSVAKEFGIPNVFKDYKKLIEMDEIDIVDICTPNCSHYQITIDSLKAGKHVICEKPLAISVQQVKEMINTARRYKKKLMSIQNHRFRPEVIKIKEMIDNGYFGETYFARAHALRRRGVPALPTFIKKSIAGGGPMFDIGVHILDLTYWLMGCPEVKSVTGITLTKLAKQKDIRGDWGEWDRDIYDVEDFSAGFVKFKDGSGLNIETSFLLNMKEKEIFATQVFGTKGGFYIPWGSPAEIYTEKNGIHMTTQITNVPEVAPHQEQINAFIESVLEDKPLPVPPEQSLEVIKILEAIYISNKTGKEVIF